MLCIECKERPVSIKKRNLCKRCANKVYNAKSRKKLKNKPLVLKDPRSFRAIGEKLGVSHETVRKDYFNAMEKLRNNDEAKKLLELYIQSKKEEYEIPELRHLGKGASLLSNSFYSIFA